MWCTSLTETLDFHLWLEKDSMGGGNYWLNLWYKFFELLEFSELIFEIRICGGTHFQPMVTPSGRCLSLMIG